MIKKVNDTGMIMYICELIDNTYTRFWFMNEGIIEELLNNYKIPFKKVKPNEKYYWDPDKSSKYWKDKYDKQ